MFFDMLSDELKRSAHSLAEFGVNEFAWNYEEVRKVIIYLADHDYAILGGDVYRKEGESFISTYDSWYLDWDSHISWEEYIKQSKEKTLTYVDFYYKRNGEKYYYVPVASLTNPKRI